jgi:phospholipase/carboxylesterase
MKLHSVELAPRAPGLSRTLILLHGFGADEHDLLPIAHELDPRLRAVSLRAPLSLGGTQRAWFNLTMGPRGISFDEAEVRAGLHAAIEAVEEIAAISQRPILCGFSQGAGISVGVALKRPELVGPVLSFSGVLRALRPDDLAPPDQLRDVHVFAAHGLQDPIVPLALGRVIRDELTRVGADLSWHEYPMGHTIIPVEIHDAREWLRRLL